LYLQYNNNELDLTKGAATYAYTCVQVFKDASKLFEIGAMSF